MLVEQEGLCLTLPVSLTVGICQQSKLQTIPYIFLYVGLNIDFTVSECAFEHSFVGSSTRSACSTCQTRYNEMKAIQPGIM